ncbi:hypothetical protein BDA96_06G121800 [Sorghum bicolor]|nr:hypothetical protein BDA96_06G121800 [Sorghum bicolor]
MAHGRGTSGGGGVSGLLLPAFSVFRMPAHGQQIRADKLKRSSTDYNSHVICLCPLRLCLLPLPDCRPGTASVLFVVLAWLV